MSGIERTEDHPDNQRQLVRDLVEMRERLAVLERLTAAHQREYEQLRERAELYRQLVENSQGLACTHDLDGNLLYVSPASAWELGYSPGEGVGRNLREFLAPSVRVFFQAYLDRIREEVRAGRTAINAIDAGFSRALATILDSNITTFIAAAVLFYIGTGPVRGFAVTLGIGIITTVFTAFTLTRLIVAYWVRWRRPQRVPI